MKLLSKILVLLALCSWAVPGLAQVSGIINGGTPIVGGTTGQCVTRGSNGTVLMASCTGSGVVSSWSGGTTGLLPSAATTGAVSVTGVLVGANGGTGVANTGKTITLGGNLTTSGAFATTLAATATTSITLPTTGTLATLAGSEALTNKTINGQTITAGSGTLTLGTKTLTTSNSLTLAGTDGTTMTFPATSASIARTDAANTFTGTQTFGALVYSTLNGNTWATGTGTLSIAAGKTLTASNTLTFAGTDSSTLNIGAGGTLGSNAFTSTAYAPLASPTFTGTVTIPTPFTLGAISVTATGTQLNYLAAATGTTGTTSTNVVFSTSPTLVTPVLGVATGTSLALGGATLGSNALAVTGPTLLANGTITTDLQNLSGTATWNAAGVTFTGWKLNVTSTASAAASLLMDLQVGGTSKFAINKTGDAFFAAQTGINWNAGTEAVFSDAANDITFWLNGARRAGFNQTNKQFVVASDYNIGFRSATTINAGTFDTMLTRRAAANLNLGAADAAAPVAQTLSVQSVVAGTSNTAGSLWSFVDSSGTGSATSGGYSFYTHPLGGSGTSQNTAVAALSIAGNGSVTISKANDDQLFIAALSGGQYSTLTFRNNVTNKAFVYYDNTTNAMALGTSFAGGSLLLRTGNNAAAVTIDSAALATFAGGITQAVAQKFSVTSGTNQRAGNATLVGGTVTVSNTTVTANTVVLLTRKTSGGTVGTAVTYTLSAGTSFTITSDNVLDTSTFSYWLIEVP